MLCLSHVDKPHHKVTHKHLRATSYHTAEVDNCSAKHSNNLNTTVHRNVTRAYAYSHTMLSSSALLVI